MTKIYLQIIIVVLGIEVCRTHNIYKNDKILCVSEQMMYF